MNAPDNPPPPPAPLPQPPLSEAVEQAAAQARHGIDNLERFAQQEVRALADGTYGLSELATAPVRLFGVLLANAIRTASTVSDNLALLALTGRFGDAAAERAIRVPVEAAAPDGVQVSDLVGELTGHRIARRNRIAVEPKGPVAAGDVVTITVRCAGAPSDIYLGRLFALARLPGGPSQEIRVAINEIGVPVT